MRCKRMYVNARFSLAGGLIKQTTAAADWSVHLQRTDRSQRVLDEGRVGSRAHMKSEIMFVKWIRCTITFDTSQRPASRRYL